MLFYFVVNRFMAYNINLYPSTLQFIQNSRELSMVAKPLYGILSNAIYISDDHGIHYICIRDKLTYSCVALSFICLLCFL